MHNHNRLLLIKIYFYLVFSISLQISTCRPICYNIIKSFLINIGNFKYGLCSLELNIFNLKSISYLYKYIPNIVMIV